MPREVRTKRTRVILFILSVFLWIIGLGILAVGIWLLIDPRRWHIKVLVNYYKKDVLFLFIPFIFIGVGCATIIVAILGCCGIMREIQTILTLYCLVLGIVLCAQMTAGITAVSFREQMTRDMKSYLFDLAHNCYGHDKLVTYILDTIQFYQKCCGSTSSADYNMSYWQNSQRGAVLYVPISCCAQTQDANPFDNLRPIDDRCQEFPYGNMTNGTVYQQGCYEKLMLYFNENSLIFIILGFGISAISLTGIGLSMCMFRSIRRRMI